MRECSWYVLNSCYSDGSWLTAVVEDHLARYDDLVQQVEELEAHSEAERRAFDQRSASVADDFISGIEKIDLAVNQVEALLSGTATEGAAQDLMELDQAMRDDLVSLIAVKVSLILSYNSI